MTLPLEIQNTDSNLNMMTIIEQDDQANAVLILFLYFLFPVSLPVISNGIADYSIEQEPNTDCTNLHRGQQ